ncbi:MAG TPA: hypothetical protein VH370_22575 [Humisphaera sp.]|nr:hypothetical protein [Humisphaera sp.]
MTAVSLFDVLARDKPETNIATGESSLASLAEKLVAAALADWERLKEYEQEFGPGVEDDPAIARDVLRSMYNMLREWAEDADQILGRARKLAAAGRSAPKIEALEDAYCMACARLKLTPEDMMRAMEQVRQGKAIPAEELRNELRARLRA